MIEINYTKLHGAENDFLLSWGDSIDVAKLSENELPESARRICARMTGVGADGWMLAWQAEGGLRTRLFNSDGSEAEISGNGTRCAAAFALIHKSAHAPDVAITTAAGRKTLRLISGDGQRFLFEMDMGLPRMEDLRATIHLAGRDWDASILNVGNPQCAIFVNELPEDWRTVAAEAEGHARFPKRSNVSLVKVIDRHAIEVVFFERGAGETRSSGTGSTGAAAASILRGLAESPVEIRTPAGALGLRWDDSVYLTGPAELVAEGRYFLAT
jgi:diaminopimelate epimerase